MMLTQNWDTHCRHVSSVCLANCLQLLFSVFWQEKESIKKTKKKLLWGKESSEVPGTGWDLGWVLLKPIERIFTSQGFFSSLYRSTFYMSAKNFTLKAEAEYSPSAHLSHGNGGIHHDIKINHQNTGSWDV